MNQIARGLAPLAGPQPAQGEPPPGAPAGIVLPGGTRDNPLAIGVSATPPTVAVPMTHVRQVSVQNLELSQRSTAPVTVVAEADVSRLQQVHDGLKPSFEASTGVPLTYLPFFARATVRALMAYPIMNASMTAAGHVIPRYIHLGYALQSSLGVLIPTIWHAESKPIAELAREIHTQSQRARSGLITPQEMSGQTFVITNTGRYGKTLFGTPIIKPSNVGALAFETIQKRPVVDEQDRVVARPMMYLALTADHRAVDGADMIGFIGKVKECLERLDL